MSSDSDPRLDDVWVDAELALCVRYRIGDELLAERRARLDIDPTSLGAPTDSARSASDLFHNLHAAEGDRPYVDRDGYRWCGDTPAGGWADAAPRAATFLP